VATRVSTTQLVYSRLKNSPEKGLLTWVDQLAHTAKKYLQSLFDPLRDNILFQEINDKYKYLRKIYKIKEYMNKTIFVITFKIHQHHYPIVYFLNQII
jgi:hypothetical protein